MRRAEFDARCTSGEQTLALRHDVGRRSGEGKAVNQVIRHKRAGCFGIAG